MLNHYDLLLFVCVCLLFICLFFLGLPSQKFHKALIVCSRVCNKKGVRVCKVQRSSNCWHFPTVHVILFCFVFINYKFQRRRSLLKKIASGYCKYFKILIWGQVFIVIIDLTLKLKIKCLLWTYISILCPQYEKLCSFISHVLKHSDNIAKCLFQKEVLKFWLTL